jgi:orotidine-5'-phosphate decarboxylase
MRKAAKYLRNLAKEASTPGDDTLMTKAEFEAKIKSSLEQAKNGEVVTLLPGENIEDLLARCGYEI